LVALLLGAIETWLGRFFMANDGIQYLDNAAVYWRGDFHNALNTLWSPLYSWLMGALSAIVRPTREQQFPLVHLLNFFLYAMTLASFLFFLRCVRPLLPARSEPGFVLLSGAAFLYCSLVYTALLIVTPDLLVSFFAFVAAGLLVRIARGEAGARDFAVLGAALGFGYLGKAPFLPIGVLCLFMAAWFGRKRALLTCAIFIAIAGSYVWALSQAKGRFTWGDSAWVNVAFHVNGVPNVNWQGEPEGSGRPVHPTRQLSMHPAIFEFATPIPGTYPPWYDPAYWNQGVRITRRPGAFAAAVKEQIRLYASWLHRQLPLLFAFLALFLLTSDKRRTLVQLKTLWPVLALGAMPFAMYAPIYAEGRYLAPFCVLLWAALFACVLQDRRTALAIGTVAAILMMIEPLGLVYAARTFLPRPRLHYEIADSLQALGLKPGDQVGLVHDGLFYYWAYLAGARVTLEIYFSDSRPDREAEWSTARQVLASQAAIFLVSPRLDGVTDQAGWLRLGTTDVFAYPVRASGVH
jgi:hypothetical protein